MAWFERNPELWVSLYKRNKKRFRIAGYVTGALFLILVILIWSDIPPMTEIENPRLDRSTQLYSADGKLIGTFYSDENRIYVPLYKISKHVVDALIATEDIRFHDHNGIDPKSYPAIAKDILVSQEIRGGSTITMQLARNLYKRVGKERTVFRKLKEMIVSILLERKFTKEEIIEAYLNTASFYGDTYGIENAAQTLFGKPAENLNMEESATLVGMLKGPSLYNPVRRPDITRKRRNIVFNQMVRYRFITERKADSLKTLPLKLNFSKTGAPTTSLAPYFKDYVKTFLKEWLKAEGKDYDLYADGLKVYTTIDSRMQAHAEKAVDEHMPWLQDQFNAEMKRRKKKPWEGDAGILKRAIERTDRYQDAIAAGERKTAIKDQFLESAKMKIWTWEGWKDTTMTPMDSVIHYLQFLQTGMVAMDPKNGAIKAWVGGINYRLYKYDHAWQAKRQVGSTFKPFVYAQAISESRLQPCDYTFDAPVTFDLSGGRSWTPSNSGGGSRGMLTYYKALSLSLNQVTAGVMKDLGPDGPAKVCALAKRLGIHSKLDCVPALCLGTSDITVMELVNAYCAFVNHGNSPKPMFITRIEDRFGNVLVEFKPDIQPVLNPNTAYAVVTMLLNNVLDLEGTGRSLLSYGIRTQVGGKTGTTQDNTDGWFVGVTPDLVGAVWVGCEDQNVHFLSTAYGQGARAALPVFGKFMNKVTNDREIRFPSSIFVQPEEYSFSIECGPPPDSAKTDTLPDDENWIR